MVSPDVFDANVHMFDKKKDTVQSIVNGVALCLSKVLPKINYHPRFLIGEEFPNRSTNLTSETRLDLIPKKTRFKYSVFLIG